MVWTGVEKYQISWGNWSKHGFVCPHGFFGLFILNLHRISLAPRGEADHSLPSSAEVKNGGAIPPLPHMA
jgi:hypothetical protein